MKRLREPLCCLCNFSVDLKLLPQKKVYLKKIQFPVMVQTMKKRNGQEPEKRVWAISDRVVWPL